MIQSVWKTVQWRELSYDPAIPSLGTYTEELKAGALRDTCPPKCQLMYDWINKMWNIHTTEYYSALKRKEIRTQATTRMSLEDFRGSERASPKCVTFARGVKGNRAPVGSRETTAPPSTTYKNLNWGFFPEKSYYRR